MTEEPNKNIEGADVTEEAPIAAAPVRRKPGPKAKATTMFVEPVRGAIWDINAKRCDPAKKVPVERYREQNRWVTKFATKPADKCELPIAKAKELMRSQQAMPWIEE